MKLALIMVILTVAVAAPPEEEFDYIWYHKCIDKCLQEHDDRKMIYVCYKANNKMGYAQGPCFFDCEKKNKEYNRKTVKEVECDFYAGCYNNCTEEEKQFENKGEDKWCSREGDKLVKGYSICYVKCQSRHNLSFKKEPEVTLC